MSMNGVDYTKKINKARERFTNELADNSKTYQKGLAKLRDNHESVEKKQKETYMRERDNQQDDYTNSVNRIRKSTVESLQEKSDNYKKELSSQREGFFEERQDKQLDYSTRIAELGEDYHKNVGRQQEMHDGIQHRTREISNEKVGEIRKHHQEQVESFLEKTKDSSEEVKRQARSEKRELVRNQNHAINEMRQENTEKTNFMKDEMRKDIDRMRDVQEKELSTQRDNQEKNFSKVRHTTNKKVDDAFENFADLNKMRTEQQVREIKQNQKGSSERIEDVKKDYSKSLDSYKAKVERKLEIQTGDDKFALTQMGVKDRGEYQKKLKKVQGKQQQTLTGIFDKMEDDRALNQKFNQKKSEVFANRSKEQERDFFKTRSTDLAKMRKSENKLKDDHEYIQLEKKHRFSQNLKDQEDNSSERLKNLKQSFSDTVIDLGKKNNSALSEMRKDTERDKSTFMRVAREHHADELYSMRQNFRDKFLMNRTELNRQIGSLQRENRNLKTKMTDKVDDVIKKSKMELAFNKQVFADQINENKRIFDEEKKVLQSEFRAKVFSMREENQKKMEAITYEGDRKLKEVTREFEGKMTTNNHQTRKEKEKMIQTHNRDIAIMKQQNEAEKSRLTAQFRNQLEDQSNAYKGQLNNISDFKQKNDSTNKA